MIPPCARLAACASLAAALLVPVGAGATTGPSSALEGRAWELVSPAAKKVDAILAGERA